MTVQPTPHCGYAVDAPARRLPPRRPIGQRDLKRRHRPPGRVHVSRPLWAEGMRWAELARRHWPPCSMERRCVAERGWQGAIGTGGPRTGSAAKRKETSSPTSKPARSCGGSATSTAAQGARVLCARLRCAALAKRVPLLPTSAADKFARGGVDAAMPPDFPPTPLAESLNRSAT